MVVCRDWVEKFFCIREFILMLNKIVDIGLNGFLIEMLEINVLFMFNLFVIVFWKFILVIIGY